MLVAHYDLTLYIRKCLKAFPHEATKTMPFGILFDGLYLCAVAYISPVYSLVK